ncbi:MAG: ABC transporter substrate-binding protein [Haloarculaceae archaeon]
MRDNDRTRDKLSRRRYAQILAAGGIAGLAGCGGGESTATPGGGDGDDTPTATATPTEAMGDGSSDDTPTATPEQTRPPDSARQTDTAEVFVTNTPGEFDANPFTPSDNTAGQLYFQQLHAFSKVNDLAAWSGSRTFEVPHHIGRDEIEVVCWLTDWEVEVPYDHYNYHDDRCTYWNGEPYDAEARYLHDRVRYFSDGNKYAEGSVHRQEATSQWDYHWWRPKGEVPGAEADPANEIVLGNDARVTGGANPLPPEWSEPWIRRFEAAGTQESYQEQIGNLRGDRISLERMAENGWGTGTFEIRSPDDVSSDSVILRLRDDSADAPHPNADHINFDMMNVNMGNPERHTTLASNGRIDVDEGAVTPNGQWNRDLLGDHQKEVVRYLQASGGDSVWWNMNNPHLENLWVRRAIATVVDWEVAGNNGWGEQRSIPLEHDTGLLDILTESTFSEEFLDSLHSYPTNADSETATEYMQNAGYERQGGAWVSPDGNEANWEIQIPSAIQDWVGAAQTIRQQLREFGFNVSFSSYDWSTWSNNLNTFEHGPNYDLSIHWYGQDNVFGHYKSQAAWWDNGSIIDGDPNGTGGDRRSVDPDDDYTITNQPVTAELPTEVGSLEAPTEPGNPPDLSGNGIDAEEVNLAEIFGSLTEPFDNRDALQEALRTCARYYNYYLPKYAFHQYVYGAWGDVQDFDWPPAGHDSLKWEREFDIKDTITKGGIIQASYDDEMDR